MLFFLPAEVVGRGVGPESDRQNLVVELPHGAFDQSFPEFVGADEIESYQYFVGLFGAADRDSCPVLFDGADGREFGPERIDADLCVGDMPAVEPVAVAGFENYLLQFLSVVNRRKT